MSSAPDIVRLLREASYAYYSDLPLLMDNDTYDGMVERLRELDPANSYLQEGNKSTPDTPFKQFACISGQRNKEFEEKANKKGISFTTILTPHTTLLIVPDLEHRESSTVLLAKSIGIPILTRSQFIQQYLS